MEEEKKKKKSLWDKLADGFKPMHTRAMDEVHEENEEYRKKVQSYRESVAGEKAKRLKKGL